jgi:hypothetical protein
MATGIEMLGQMGTDQSLAGPVQGGNMVVKPNQVPVGGAAMLSKALRRQADKGVGGMYVLPEQEESMPGFMQMAQQNVNEDMTRMARTVEAEAPPGHMLSYITPEEAGILKLLGGTGDINPVTGIPQFPQYGGATGESDEDEQATAYGYQTDDTSQGYQTSQDAGGGGEEAWTSQGAENVANIVADMANNEQLQTDIDAGGTQQPTEAFAFDLEAQQNNADEIQDQLDKLNKKEQEGTLTTADKELIKSLNKEKDATAKILQQIFKQQQETRYGDIDKEKMSEADIKKLLEQAERYGVDSFNTEQMAQYKALKMSKDKHPGIQMLDAIGLSRDMPGIHASIESLGDDNTLALVGFNQGHLGKDGKLTKKGKAFYNKYDDKMGFVGMESVEDYEKKLGSLYSFDDKGKVKMESDVLGGTQAQRAINPEEYYLGSDKAKYYGSGATSGRMKELAGVALTGDKNFDRRIIEAREIASRQRDRQDGGGGQRPGAMGGGTAPVIEDEVTEAVVEEGATTMPYTGPRTGGAEVNVPLSRRFALDPTQQVAQYKTAPRSTEDIYKYFTEGTTGEGRMLEPYGEFQKRRRKALGKKPLDFWSY